ncbi:hypothetical protein HYI36_14840 [Bacillus sp. Gen3]|nr:hypothetical protein [Bacillus sp. Gen3]
MTIAELHGKLSPYERMEDLLTSDVFSTFKYLEPDNGLVPFLKKAISFIDKTHPKFLLDIKEANYVFWPKTTHLNREPDVLIVLTKKDKSTISILIEAKYTSGKSNLIREKEEGVGKLNLDHLDGDQLAELYKELQEGNIHIENQKTRDKFIKSEGNRYLFYVTSHYDLPKQDIDETLKILKKKSYGNQKYKEFYWVNWMCILDSIDEVNGKETWAYAPPNRLLLSDLKDLLLKKELVPFYGFSNLQVNFTTPDVFFWREEFQNRENLLFWSIDIKRIKRDIQNYFWMGE